VTLLAAPSVARAETGGDALAAYEDRAVGVRTIVPLGRDGVTLDRTGNVTWDAFHGRDHHPIDEEAFFRIVGGDDLATRYHRKAVVTRSLNISGGAAIAGGLIYSFFAFWYEHPVSGPSCLGCTVQPTGPSPSWGLVAAGAGLASLVLGHTLSSSPIGAEEADRLARDHDEQLKASLGLSDVAAE